MQTNTSDPLDSSPENKKSISAYVFKTTFLVALLFIVYFVASYVVGKFSLTPADEKSKTEQLGEDTAQSCSKKDIVCDSQSSADLSELKKALSEQVEQRYVLVDDSELILVSLQENGTDIQTGITEITYGSGSAAYGSADPSNSPDFKKIAYIDANHNLHIMTSEGTGNTQVSDNLVVTFISGWSPDSKKLLFYSSSESIIDAVFSSSPGNEPTRYTTFDKNERAPGFYLLDIEAESLTHLSIFDDISFGAWIDNSRVLLKIDYEQKKFLVFDLDTYTLDAELMSGGLEKDFGTQYVFNQTGKKWALTWHGGTQSTDTASIILADFPSVEGKVLSQAAFAQIQGPVISPDGEKVAFRGYDLVNGPQYVHLYDGATVTRVADGYPRDWVSNSEFIYLQTDPSYATNPQMGTKLFKYSVDTGTATELYSFSAEK